MPNSADGAVMNLQRMLQIIQAYAIEFSPEQNCFILKSRDKKTGELVITRCYGLTKIIKGILPVPRSEGKYAPADVEPLTDQEVKESKKKKPKGFRKTKKDPMPRKTVWKIAQHPLAQRIFKIAAPSCNYAIARSVLDQIADNKGRDGKGTDHFLRHGILVDETIKTYVMGGSEALTRMASSVGIDPCAATLIDYFPANGYRIVACQLPLHSQLMGVATALDVMVTDVATGTESYVFEVKSTCANTLKAIESGDNAFEMLRGRLQNTTLRGMVLSQYGVAQVQAWTQMAMIKEVTGMTPTGVSVLRVSPGVVREYPLNEYYEERAENLAKAIAIQTGQHKRNLKRAREEKKEEKKKAKVK